MHVLLNTSVFSGTAKFIIYNDAAEISQFRPANKETQFLHRRNLEQVINFLLLMFYNNKSVKQTAR